MDKRELRRDLFARVRTLSVGERCSRSDRIREFLADDPAFQAARSVSSFLALPGEPDLAPLMGSIPEQTWSFPRVSSEGRLVFHTIDSPEDGIRSDFGILEPDPVKHPELSPAPADLILVPGVGFDPATRARLGRGKGHYDRFLAAALASSERPFVIGVAFSVQLAELTMEAHDVPMDRLLTDAGWI